ncbi:bacterioferritin [Planctomycetaceae bacterium]|nr:bacterioferritin [Planctomycetaceae bacterium]
MPSSHDKIEARKVIGTLNAILELELAGVVRYTHYSLMVFGHARIPIIKWMRDQAMEGMAHASAAGEHVTTLGGHPSLKIGKLDESHKHDINQILSEALEHEQATLSEYYNLLKQVEGKSVWLEEYAREQIQLEEAHIAEVEKMLRKPGDLNPAG